MVSSISRLLVECGRGLTPTRLRSADLRRARAGDACAVTGASHVPQSLSNPYATAEPGAPRGYPFRLLVCLVAVALLPAPASAQADVHESTQGVNRTAAVGKFLTGAMVGLAAHEGGHLLFDGDLRRRPWHLPGRVLTASRSLPSRTVPISRPAASSPSRPPASGSSTRPASGYSRAGRASATSVRRSRRACSRSTSARRRRTRSRRSRRSARSNATPAGWPLRRGWMKDGSAR